MASSSSLKIIDDVHEKYETLSVYNCILCNILLNGQAVMLDCLHVICHKCLKEKMNDSGLQCKCLTVTNSFDTQYPIVSPSLLKSKICDTCDSVANKNCVYCKKFYCKPCAKVHLSSIEGRTHNPDLVISYPMKSQFVLCPKCTKKGAEVFCTECSVMICSLCHLSFHRSHDYKILNDISEKLKTSLSEEMLKLNKNYEYLAHAFSNVSKETQKLEIKKKSIFDEIEILKQKLHDEINKRSLELKELAERNFKDSIDKINSNGEILQDTQKKNKYHMNLIQNILKLDKVDAVVSLSKIVFKKLGEPNEEILMSEKVSGLKVDVKFNSDESFENCISAIKNIGYIIKTSKKNSEDFINTPASNSNDNHIVLEDILSNSSDSDSDSDYQPLVECSCCTQWAEKLIQCNSCNRRFHHDCHIPTLNKDMYNSDPSQTTWMCTICQDITRYSKVLNQRDMSGEIPVSKTERVVMERILMEIYCQNSDSEHFRELPNEEIYPDYYKKVLYPLSLNNVKTILESEQSYTSLIQFLVDLKHVFQNGIDYYTKCDPYHRSAESLKLLLERLINRWIPKLRDDNRIRQS